MLALTLLGALAARTLFEPRDDLEVPSTAEARSPGAAPSSFSPREPQTIDLPEDWESFQDPASPDFEADLSQPDTESPASAREVASSYSWYRDADGFVQGFEEADRERKAVLVYFYTDWCPYCRRLEGDLLTRARVEETTKYFVKIKINPEAGQAERLLANRYGVTGYPSLYVHSAGSDSPAKIGSMTRRDGQWRTSSPEEFVATLNQTSGERFGPR